MQQETFQQLLLSSGAGLGSTTGGQSLRSPMSSASSRRGAPPRIGGAAGSSPAYSLTMNPSQPHSKPNSARRVGAAGRTGGAGGGGGDGGGLTPRWERPLPERLATRLPASPVRHHSAHTYHHPHNSNNPHGDGNYELPDILSNAPLALPAPLDDQVLLAIAGNPSDGSGSPAMSSTTHYTQQQQQQHHVPSRPPILRLGSPQRRAQRHTSPSGETSPNSFLNRTHNHNVTTMSPLQHSSGEARRIMDRLRDGVSSLCLSADSVLANLNDYDAGHRNAEEATRKTIMAEIRGRPWRSEGHGGDSRSSVAERGWWWRHNASFSSDTQLIPHHASATEALETVLESLLIASGNPPEEALLAALANHRSAHVQQSQKARGVTLGLGGGGDATASRDASSVGGAKPTGLQVTPPTLAVAPPADNGSGAALTLSKRKLLPVEKALGEHGLGPTDTSDELFDIYDAQMHLQTVLHVTRMLTTDEGGLLAGILPPPPSSSKVLQGSSSSATYGMSAAGGHRRGSLSNLTPPAVAAAEEQLLQQQKLAMMMESVRTASKQAAMHLHNAVDVFRLQRLEIAALQEQQRKAAAASLFTANFPVTPLSSSHRGGGGGYHSHRHNSAPTYASSTTSHRSLLRLLKEQMVAIDLGHLLDIEFTSRQSSAMRSLFHRFVHGVVERCEGATVVRETGDHHHDSAGGGVSGSSTCCCVVSFTEPAEVLCFERAVQFFSCYLPWRLTAACHGPLPTLRTSASSSVILQQRLVEDIAAAAGAGGASTSLLSFSAGGAGGVSSSLETTEASKKQSSGTILLPSLCLGSMIPLHGSTSGDHPGAAAAVQHQPLTRDQRGDLTQVLAKLEDACRLVAIREIQSCLNFVRQEKQNAVLKAHIMQRQASITSSNDDGTEAQPQQRMSPPSVVNIATTMSSVPPSSEPQALLPSVNSNSSSTATPSVTGGLGRNSASSPDPRHPLISNSTAPPRVALVVPPEDDNHNTSINAATAANRRRSGATNNANQSSGGGGGDEGTSAAAADPLSIPTMDAHIDELCQSDERLMFELTKKQISSGDQPFWAVRGPLLRCSIHFGNALVEAKMDRYRSRNRLLDTVSLLQGRCRGGLSVVSAEAKRQLFRYLAAMDADVYEVDNGNDATIPTGHGMNVVAPSSVTMSSAVSSCVATQQQYQQQQKRIAKKLCSPEFQCPVHYELCWGNHIARYTYLAGLQAQASKALAGTMAGNASIATAAAIAVHRGVPPQAIALRDFVSPIGYDVDWWVNITSGNHCSSPIAIMRPSSAAVTSAATQTGEGGAYASAGSFLSPRGGSKKATTTSASPSPLRRRASATRGSGSGDEVGSDNNNHNDDPSSLLGSAQNTGVFNATATERRSSATTAANHRRRSSGAASATSTTAALATTLASANTSLSSTNPTQAMATSTGSGPAGGGGGGKHHRRKSSSVAGRSGGGLSASQRPSLQNHHHNNTTLSLEYVREVGMQTNRDAEDVPILGGGGASLRVSTKLLLESCRWMYEWIEGAMDEDSVVTELHALLGVDDAVASVASSRGTPSAATTPSAAKAPTPMSTLSASGPTSAPLPQWGDLTSLAEELLSRFNAWPYGDDALASRAAMVLQFCAMRDVLREVSLYRRRRSSNATPNSATAAAAAANARRASHSISLTMPQQLLMGGAGGGGQAGAVKRPQPIGKSWQDAKNQVVANPTAALAGGQRPVIGAILGAHNGGGVASPSPSRTSPATAVIVGSPTSRMSNGGGGGLQSPGRVNDVLTEIVAGGPFLPGPF
ncbi:GPI-anchored surface protein, putative [Bodo saltans]|uniref:GPI-anchored surface protein, putative n=1 Tax=Bodo saltans TaxID=75058 RepID=A0A0S4JL45_BODSA|nr:GPI-anchored surface protein, putative [Bodo saltans]|eukprot:CUG90893.1 GPI-anchored surface protein, putative [Bodo saltans]